MSSRDALRVQIRSCSEGEVGEVWDAMKAATGRYGSPQCDVRVAASGRVGTLTEKQADWILHRVWPQGFEAPNPSDGAGPDPVAMTTSELIDALGDAGRVGQNRAQAAYGRALADRPLPDDRHLLNAGAAALRRAGYLRAALEWGVRSVEAAPSVYVNAVGYTALGAALRQAGLLPEAEALLQDVVDAHPRDSYALAALAAVYSDLARGDEAEELFRRAEEAGWTRGPTRSDRRDVQLDTDLLARIRTVAQRAV